MNQLGLGLRILAVTITLMLPWSAAQALEKFHVYGKITATGINSFTVKDQDYRVHPVNRFTSDDSSRQRATDPWARSGTA